MQARTGQTIFENILSVDADNNAVSAVTFDITTIQNGIEYSGITVTMTLVDAARGIFSSSWSADTIGDYQNYIKNNNTNVIFISDIVNILPDSAFDQTIYIGL